MLCFVFSKSFVSSSLGIKPVNAGRERPTISRKNISLPFFVAFCNWRCYRGPSSLCSSLHLKWANRMPSSARLFFYPSFNISLVIKALTPVASPWVGLVTFCWRTLWIFTAQHVWACLLPTAFLSNERKLTNCRWVLCLCVINTIKISITG